MREGMPRELILEGGTIRTMDPELGCVEAVGIAGGRIKAVGQGRRPMCTERRR
jgi:predicted amidohydrolase YtcJ